MFWSRANATAPSTMTRAFASEMSDGGNVSGGVAGVWARLGHANAVISSSPHSNRGDNGRQSVDYLVGAREQYGRHLESKRLRGSEVDHELKLGGQLHRQIAWFGAFEDAIDIRRCSSPRFAVVDSVGNQPSCSGHEARRVNRWYAVTCRQ